MDRIINLKSGYQEIVIDNEYENITLLGNLKSDVLLRVKNCKEVNITSNVSDRGNVTLLIWNESEVETKFNEVYEVDSNSTLNIAYGDLNGSNIIRNSTVNLNGSYASALVKSACLCKNKKHYSLIVNSKVPYTSGKMENYSVVLDGGNYKMDATGQIEKGAFKSESHQTSRALSFDENQVSTIIPKLIIDDNDVMASHATSVGRVDDNQLIYMQSRGLTIGDVMALVSTGYLLPIADFIDNKELRESLRSNIESMVNKECSM